MTPFARRLLATLGSYLLAIMTTVNHVIYSLVQRRLLALPGAFLYLLVRPEFRCISSAQGGRQANGNSAAGSTSRIHRRVDYYFPLSTQS